MKKIFLAIVFILCFAHISYAATGDITAVRIAGDPNASGWFGEIDISGFTAGGAYDLGVDTINYNIIDPNEATVIFTVTRQGFDANCAITTLTDTIYGTNYKRKLYPNQAQADETESGGTLTTRVALQDYIFQADANITVDIEAGFYTDANLGANNAASAVAVTNSSIDDYPRVVGNWDWPGWRRITGSSFTLRCWAYHRSAREKKPVRAVKFTATDEHSNTVTTIVTSPTKDITFGDAEVVTEYVGTLSTSTLTQGDLITSNFAAYPWYGDANSVLDTSDGVNTMPTPLYAPQYHLCDKSGTYGVSVACVDPAGGSGTVVDYAVFNPSSPPNKYATIAAAATAIAAYNNTNRSRNDVGGGIIYLSEGNHVWTGGTVTAGNNPETWITITKFPGTTRANVCISSGSGTKQISEKVKLEDVRITNTTATAFAGMDYLWIHNCDINPSGAGTFYTNTCNYFTQCNLWNRNEFAPYSTVNAARCLIRGCTSMETVAQAFRPYVMVGNHIQLNSVLADYAGQLSPPFSNMIYACNFLGGHSTSTALIGHLNLTDSETHGVAIIQNVLEHVVGTSPCIQIAADMSSSDPVNNVMICGNTMIGQRFNGAYNDWNLNDPNDALGPVYRKYWMICGNIFDDYNCVTDIDTHTGPPDAIRYGNHAIIHGVGQWGNVVLNRAGAGGYLNKFGGEYYISGSNLDPAFTDDQSDIVSGTGDGDYTLTETSYGLNFVPAGAAILPFDLAGEDRNNEGEGASGAYEFISGWQGTIFIGGKQIINPAQIFGIDISNIDRIRIGGVDR